MAEININENRKWLYDALTSTGVEMGTYEEFDKNADVNKDWLYNTAMSKGIDIGDYDAFDKAMGLNQAPVAAAPVSGRTEAEETPSVEGNAFSYDSPAKRFVEEGLAANNAIMSDYKAEPVKDEKGNAYYPVKPKAVAEDEFRRQYRIEPVESQINQAIADNEETIRRIEQSKSSTYDKQAEDHPFLHALGGFARQHEGRVPDVNPSYDKEALRNLYAERDKLMEAKRAIDASRTKGVLNNIGKGIKDAVGSTQFWDFGMSEMSGNSQLMNIKNKLDNKQELTEEEQKLLNASALAQDVNVTHQDRISPWYRAGSTTANMIPFMAEMAVNPASGLGQAAQKAVTRKMADMVGKSLVKKILPKLTRVAGDIAGASVMTGTTGAMRTIADADSRMLGGVDSSISDGKVTGEGFSGGLDKEKARSKAFAANTIENWTEMLGDYLAPALKGLGKVSGKAVRNMGMGKVADFISGVNSTQFARTLDDFLEETKWSGPIGEIAEEEAGIIANSYITGDNKLSDLIDPKQQLDIVLGVGLFGGFVSGIKTMGYRNPSQRADGDLKKSNENASSLFDNWDDLRTEIDGTDDAELLNVLDGIVNGEAVNGDYKRKAAVIDYAYSLQKWRGVNAAKLKQSVENPEIIQELVENGEEDSYVPAIDKVNVYRNFKRAERKVAQLLPGMSEETLNGITDVDEFTADNNLNDAQKTAVADYMSAREPYNNYQSEANTRREAFKTNAREQASADIDKIINKDNGFVIQAKHKFLDNPVYIERENLVFDEDGLLDKEKTSEIVYYQDENGDIVPASPDNFDGILSQNTKDELVAEAEAQADADFAAQEEESLASPDIPVPERGITVAIKGENYLIEGPDEDNPGNVLAYKLDANGEIDKQEDSSQVLSLSPDEYYSAKEAELWNNDEQTADVANPESPETEETATDIPVSEIRETGTGEAADTAQGVNTSENQPRNESDPADGDSKVSEEGQEETPEQRMQRIIDSLPKKKDGKIDYKALTPRQQYDYTSVTESEEVAASDLREEISAREKELKKMNERLTKVTGGERAEVRDAIRERRTALDELQSFYNTIAPASVEQQAEAQDNSIPNDLRTDEDYISWVADNSDDVKEIADAYAASKELASHEQTLKPWQRELLGRRINSDSFYRFGDRNHITGGLAKAWLRKDGEGIDTLAQELSTFGGEVTEQDIVDFILANPSNRVSQISDDMRNLSRRFGEMASKELGFPVGGPESNTGKLYLQLKEAKAQVDNLTDVQKDRFTQAVAVDMDDADKRRADGYYESLGDYAQQYDRFRNELDAESADEAVIQMMEDNRPQLYHGGSTADELDDIYSQIENNNGTERQTEDSRENQSPVFGEEVGRYEESGTPEALGTENSEGEEQNSGVALNLGDNSVSLQEDNQKVNENDEISESIPQGEHGTETSQDGGLEEALAECRRRSSQDERYAQTDSRTLSERERKEIENRAAENYAKEKGVWIPMQKVFSLGVPAPSGNENDVYLDTKDNSVYKVNNLMNSGNVTSLLERLKLHNEYFPDTKYELVGFSGFENGDVFPVLKQRYIEGADFATPEDIDGYMQSLGFKQRDETTYSNGDVTISDLRPRNVLKDADGDLYVVDADFKKESGFAVPTINPGENVLDYASRISREKKMHDVRQSVNTNPTEAQKEAGNYKKGHIRLEGYDITIENPKGSESSGTDANGQAWSVTMNNDYGYIRGTKAVDGDHIDIFLSDTPMEGNVFVVDQNKEDGTFDESKVMYGFASAEEARTAYLSNYSSGWESRIGAITEVSKDEFKKWVNSFVRKTKSFADYKSVNSEDVQSESHGKFTENSISSPEISGETVVNLPKREITTENKKRSDNRLVTDERYEELKQRMKRKLGGQMNMGVDPEILAIGTEMAVYHIEKGSRKFIDYAKAMIADLGDAIRPYLKSFYNGARDLPEMEELSKSMDTYNNVALFDVANFDKAVSNMLATAETVVKEQEIKKQAEKAKDSINKKRSSSVKKKDNSVSLLLNDLDLFNQNIEGNGQEQQERRESDSRPKGNKTENGILGSRKREENRGTGLQGEAGGLSGSDVSDSKRSGGVYGVYVGESSVERNKRNYSFDEGHIDVPSGDMAKLKANVEAIRTLKEVESSGKPATDEQIKKLARYVGWGGLSNALNDDKYEARNRKFSTYYDANWNEKFLPYYEQLKGLLTPEEFKSAVQSTTTSHYTPETIIRSLWEIAERLGVRGGDVSEPAMGTGRILGMMPASISAKSRISGFEIDSISGRISQLLYPDANVKLQGYETEFFPKNKDLVITNVPFGKHAPYDKALDRTLRKKMKGAYNLHNYFIAKGLLELKDGGIGVFVTSSATMDGASSGFREFASSNGFDLIGAIRLPNDAFQKDAGTSVTADILVFRRKKQGEKSNGIGFISTTQIGEGSYQENGETRVKPIMVNEYFAAHPEMMLGDMMTAYDAGSGGLYSGASQTLKAKQGVDLHKALNNAVDRLIKNANIETGSGDFGTNNVEKEKTNLKNGTLIPKDGKIYVVMNGELEEIPIKEKFVFEGKTRKTVDAINDYNSLKSTLKSLIAEEQKENSNPEPLRKKLNEQYDTFVEKYGRLNRNKVLGDIFSEDFEHNLPFSLENVLCVPSPTGKSMVYQAEKGKGILEKRVSYPVKEPIKADNIQDAVNISRSYRGTIDIPYIAKLTGKEKEDVVDEMLREGIAYREPVTGELVDRDTYLSGNVKEKLEQARAMAENNSEFEKNVEDLASVQPETIRFGDISYRLGTPWIPAQYIDEFAEEVLGISDAGIRYMPSLNEFTVSRSARISDFAKSGAVRTDRVGTIDLFASALNQRKPKIYDERTEYGPTGRTKVRVPNEAETQAAAEKIMDISEKFIEYIDGKKDIHRELERIYNDRYNNYRLKSYELPSFSHVERDKNGEDKIVTHYPNSNAMISMREHQARAIQRSLEGSTLLAHQVGTGKTYTMITTAMEMRRLGLANKPMIVVQNATLEDFVKDFYGLYPGANVLAPGKDERSAENRKRLFNLIATGDFDAIVIPQSFMQFIPDDEGRKKELIQKRIDEYEELISGIDDFSIRKRLEKEIDAMRDSIEGVEKGKKRSVKDKAKAADRIKSRMERKLDRKTDDVMTFEQMGVDALFIDEAHNFKKIGFASKMNNVKGVDTSASQRANSLLLKAKWVQEKNGGRNVILATGTPITNTMAEVWTMMNFVAPDILGSYNIQNFDDFATTFGIVEPSLEFTATGNFKIADRFKSYVNVPELIKAFRSHADVVLTTDVKEFKEGKNIPKLKDGKMENVVIEKNEDLEDVMQVLVDKLDEYDKMGGKEKRAWSALPLVVFTKAKQAAIDLRLLNPSYADNPNSKTNQVVGKILKYYKESDAEKGTQLVFCDSYQSPGEKPQMDLFDYNPDIPRFNLYEDIKRKLMDQGIPANEIAIVNNYDGERRKGLFEKVRNGEVRVLLGSTEKMGVGVNVQDRLFVVHHIDAPIRPMDFEQRNGRILRQGNLYATWNKPVNVVTYGVMGTLDATAYDRLRVKQEFINQMMKGDIAGRVMEEQDDEDPGGMTFNQMAATLSGDKTAQLLFVAENKLKKLRNSKRSDVNSKSGMEEAIDEARNRIKTLGDKKKIYEKASMIVDKHFPNGVKQVSVGKDIFTEKLGVSLDPVISAYDEEYSLNRGTAPLKLLLNGGNAEVVVHFNEGIMVYELYAGKEHLVDGRQFNGGKGLMSSIEHQLKATKTNLSDTNAAIEMQQKKIDGLRKVINSPWGREEELKNAEKEVEDLRKKLEEKAKENSKSKPSDSVSGDDTRFHEVGGKDDVRFKMQNDSEYNNLNSENSEDQILSSIDTLSKALHTPVSVFRTMDELPEGSVKKAVMSGRNVKAWTDLRAGGVSIYLPNATSANDAVKSVLHEVVGHKGLRELLGKEGFDGMMEKLYGQLPDDIRKRVNDAAETKYNGSIAIAMDEYLAEQAEKDETPLWWNRVVSAARDFLRKLGIGVELSANDVKYLLWKSKNRLMSTDNGIALIGKIAADENMKERFHIGEYSRTPEQEKADYDRAAGVVSDFAHNHAGAANVLIIRSRDMLREQLESIGIANEFINEIEDAFNSGETVAAYNEEVGKAIILNNGASDKDLKGYLWHENTHKAIREIFGDKAEETINSVYEWLNNRKPDDCRFICNLYSESTDAVQKEECVVAYFEKMFSVHGEDKLKEIINDASSLEISNFFNKAFNNIVYGTEEGKRPLGRRFQTEVEVWNSEDARFEKEAEGKESEGRDDEAGIGEDGVIRFRDDTDDEMPDGSIEEYEAELRKQAFKAKEAYQDSMLALKKLQDIIVQKSGKELKSFEDAYTAENHLSSKNTAEVESYGEHFFRPLIDAIGELMNDGITYEDIKRYVFAKHGLERNEVFAQRDAHNATMERFWKEKEQLERQYSKGKLMEDEYEEMKQSLQQKEHDFYEQQYQENRSRDYSGLTTLTGEKDEYEKISQEIVEEFEKSNDTSDLWEAINNATKETLKKTYECGLINKGTYEKVKSQFKYYIPLRGWNEKTAEDVYEYLQSETSPVNAALKTAKGRTSLADDPFATIGNMAESNIFMSNRNLMKQRFMNMVLNHPSDAVSLSEAWYVRDVSTGDWVLSSPDIQEKDTPEEIRRKIEEHEDRMQELAKDGDATKVKEGLNINYRISDRQAREHMIVVKRNGKEYVMYINGNPRAAQAINGLTNPNVNEHPVWKWIGNVNRQLAANFTTRNPAFVATNLSRDLIYSVFSTYVKEGTAYGNRFIRNIPKAMRVVARNLRGKGGNSSEDIYFKEYLANGGETGYANLKDVEAYKKFVKKEIGKITGKKDYFKYLKACASFFSLMNRWAENVSRFNAYMTSREMGKNIFDSVSDAKEVTVNFNKKGAGYKTKGVFGLTSGTFKELFLFFNAAVQSLNNFSKIAVDHKSGFIKMVGGFTTAGFIIPALNTLATSIFGGDDDDYYNNLPEWVRRNNICVYAGSGKFITIPLPIELRAFYGLGEMAYQETIGRGHGGKRIVYDAINQITELLPINPLGNNGDVVSSFTPDIAKPFAQLIRNKDYTGKPIYKENPFNRHMPEWTKTYSGTSKWLKSLSEWTNDKTGGNKYKRGSINVNPAKVEHLFESYFGGMAKTINQTSNTLIAGVESVIDSEKSEDLIWRNAPVLNRFVSDGSDDRTAFSKVNSRYYELYDIYVDVKHQLNGYKKEISSGNFSYLEELSELQNSKEYDIYKVFEQYRKSMDELKKLEKSFHNSNKDGRREIEKDIVNIKKKIIENIDGK